MSRFWVLPPLLAILVIGPFIVWGDALTALFSIEETKTTILGYGSRGWLIGAGLLVADLFLPIPTTAVIAALGIIYGPLAGTLIALVGSLAAAIVGYGAGRFLGRPAAERFLGVSTESGERAFARYGGWIVAASRWAPVLPEVVSVLAGVSRMPFVAFIAAVICGAAPLCAIFALIGHWGADAPGWTLGFSALAPVVLWFALDRLGVAKRLGLGGGGA